jgi:hypothetical protein
MQAVSCSKASAKQAAAALCAIGTVICGYFGSGHRTVIVTDWGGFDLDGGS